MVRGRFVLHIAVLAMAFLVMSASAWGDIVVPIVAGGVNGTIWQVCGNLGNAPITAPISGNNAGTNGGCPGNGTASTLAVPEDYLANSAVEGTFTTTAINYFTTGAGTLGSFMSTGSDGTSNGQSYTGGGASSVMSNCSGAGFTPGTTADGCYSTVIKITGSINFVNGQTYSVIHDDGVQLFVPFMMVGNVLGAGSEVPTSATTSTFKWTVATGLEPFTLWYMGTNKNPEELQLMTAAVPEPASILLFGSLLVGLAGVLKRRLA